jgi:hypothetical protein
VVRVEVRQRRCDAVDRHGPRRRRARQILDDQPTRAGGPQRLTAIGRQRDRVSPGALEPEVARLVVAARHGQGVGGRPHQDPAAQRGRDPEVAVGERDRWLGAEGDDAVATGGVQGEAIRREEEQAARIVKDPIDQQRRRLVSAGQGDQPDPGRARRGRRRRLEVEEQTGRRARATGGDRRRRRRRQVRDQSVVGGDHQLGRHRRRRRQGDLAAPAQAVAADHDRHDHSEPLVGGAPRQEGVGRAAGRPRDRLDPVAVALEGCAGDAVGANPDDRLIGAHHQPAVGHRYQAHGLRHGRDIDHVDQPADRREAVQVGGAARVDRADREPARGPRDVEGEGAMKRQRDRGLRAVEARPQPDVAEVIDRDRGGAGALDHHRRDLARVGRDPGRLGRR